MNQAINEMPVTKEEDEAMDALCRLGAGVPLLNISDGGRVVQYATPQFSPQPSAEVLHKPTPDVTTIINTICEQLSLLATVINQTKAQPTQGNSLNAEDQSLQECVSATLQQAGWFEEMIGREIEKRDLEYEIDNAVESYFTNSFSIDDYVDVDSIVRDKVDDELESIVEDKLADLVSEKLSNLRITFD